jgi:membrane protease subunit (stomatin/prohibitin family)
MFSFIRNELLEVIEWKEESNDIVLWKFPDKESNIKYGAQLTVRESQMALFLNEGQLADVYMPGRHSLVTENMPILTTLKSWKYGFNSPFKCDVYFISGRQFTNMKWGTPNAIFIKDPEAGRIQIRAFGVYFIRIKDPKLFYREYAGTKDVMNISELEDTLRGLIAPKFAEALAQSGVSAFDIYSTYSALGDKIAPMLQKDMDPFGIELTKFQITSVSFPPEVEAHLNEISKLNLTSDSNMNKMNQFAQMEAMKESAKHGMNPQTFQNNQQQQFMQQMMMNQMMQNMMGGGGMNNQNMMNQNMMNQQQNQNQQNQAGGEEDIMAKIAKLNKLKEAGLVTQEEYDKKKAELLAQL